MTSDVCKTCKYVVWSVALGIGIRCTHPENQYLRKASVDHKMLPILISRIPVETGCYESIKSKES